MTHVPVLLHETLAGLALRPGAKYIDGTVGAGGHAAGILAGSAPGGELLGLDQDPAALEVARGRLAEFGDRVQLRRGSYVDMPAAAQARGWAAVDGIVLDLGLSSLQLADAGRGFAFSLDGPLDMRFDPAGPVTAADLVNETPVDELAEIIFRFGEERYFVSQRIARAIEQARPVKTSGELAEIVARIAGARPGARRRIHPATRTFQALRIAVNDELGQVRTVLPVAVELLASGGRLAVITFHSLEDRIVKDFFRRMARGPAYDPTQPDPTAREYRAVLNLITRKPVTPGEAEAAENPRSRSAKLRVVEKAC